MKRWTLAVVGLVLGGAAWAHHSVTAVFDTAKRITLAGELTDIDWVNPHIFLYVKLTNSQGAEETWKIEGGPPSWYRRVGVNKATFTKHMGEKLSVEGFPSKTGETYSFMQRITFANGDTFESASAADVSKGK